MDKAGGNHSRVAGENWGKSGNASGNDSRYNEYCKGQNLWDLDFCRDPSTLQPIDTPHYYSTECSVSVLNTEGGPRKKHKVPGNESSFLLHGEAREKLFLFNSA